MLNCQRWRADKAAPCLEPPAEGFRCRIVQPMRPTARVRYCRVDGTGTRPIVAVGRKSVSATRSLRAQRVRTDSQCSSDRFTHFR
jgi:hypothetical protein